MAQLYSSTFESKGIPTNENNITLINCIDQSQGLKNDRTDTDRGKIDFTTAPILCIAIVKNSNLLWRLEWSTAFQTVHCQGKKKSNAPMTTSKE